MKHPLEDFLKNVGWTVMTGNNWPRAYVCDPKIKPYGLPEECAVSVSKNFDFEFHVHKTGATIYLIKKQNAATLKMAGAPTTGEVVFFSDYYELTEEIYIVLKLMGMEHPKKRKVRTLDD